jgi:hypothetical protein
MAGLPLIWALNLLQKERFAGRLLIDSSCFATLTAGFDYLEICNRRILDHGWVNFPLGMTAKNWRCFSVICTSKP